MFKLGDRLQIIVIFTVYMGAFGAFLAEKTDDKSFRIDQWDITQVFASPETTEAEQDKYLVTEKDFFAAVVEASLTSPNIPKRAKANTSDRCLIMDQNGRTYIGGQNNLELGHLNSDNISNIATAIHEYNEDKKLSLQRKKQYLAYKPT